MFKRLIALALPLLVASGLLTACEPGARQIGIWLTSAEINAAPTSGAAWNRVLAQANAPLPQCRFDNNEWDYDVQVYAKALVAVRQNDEGRRNQVISALQACMSGSVPYARALEASRNLGALIISADIIGWRDAGFQNWVRNTVTRTDLGGHAGSHGDGILNTAFYGANNWGAMARFVVAAAAGYLEDSNWKLSVLNTWAHYSGQSQGGTDPLTSDYDSGDADTWRCAGLDKTGIVQVCPNGDPGQRSGGLPEELRRTGAFTPPPGPDQNYVAGATQANVGTGILLDRENVNGGFEYVYGNSAIDRSMKFIFFRQQMSIDQNDAWMVWAHNKVSGTSYPTAPLDGTRGKIMDHTDWVSPDTHNVA